MRAPVWYRKWRSRHRRRVPSTAEARLEGSPGQVGSLARARGRLAHQKKQLQKAERDLKYGTVAGKTRQQLQARRDGVFGKDSVINGVTYPSKIAYWESEVARLEAEQ